MAKLTRRRFLEDSLLVATAALVGGDSLSSALAQEAPAAGAAKTAGPNEQIRVGVIGVHGRGKDHISGYLRHKDATVAAICDVDLNEANKRAQEIEKKTGKAPKVYQDLRKMYEDKDIDAVSMAMPIHWHALASIWAMQAGKDVYVEKPVCHNVNEGWRLMEAAQKYGRICQTGTQSRSNKGMQDTMKFIHEGGIGKVTLARGLCYKTRNSIGIQPDGPVPTGVDYNIWLGPAPEQPFNPNRFHYNWHWMWDFGSGDLGNQGIHQMDLARWAINKNTLPKSVLGLGGRFGYVDQGETPNTEIALLDYGDVQLMFEVRGLKTEKVKGVSIGDIIYGENGFVAIHSYSDSNVFDNDGKKVKEFKGGGDHFRNFLDAVRSRKMSDLNAPISEGAPSSQLCHLGNISYRLGTPVKFGDKTKLGNNKELAETFERFEKHLVENGVKVETDTYRLGRHLTIDPQKQNFGNDAEANALLTRKYRAPFVVPEKL